MFLLSNIVHLGTRKRQVAGAPLNQSGFSLPFRDGQRGLGGRQAVSRLSSCQNLRPWGKVPMAGFDPHAGMAFQSGVGLHTEEGGLGG